MKQRALIPLVALGLLLCLGLFLALGSSPAWKGSQPTPSPTETQPQPSSSESADPTLTDIRQVAFRDVSSQDRQADCISYAAFYDLLPGEDGYFHGEAPATRATVLSALHRMSGEDAPAYDGRFSDLSVGHPLSGAVAWAVRAGLLDELVGETLQPEAPVTRYQLAQLLHRFGAYEDGVSYSPEDLSAYPDGDLVPEQARLPFVWAIQNGIFAGMVSQRLYPLLPVSRGQLAQALVAFTAYGTQEPVSVTLTRDLRIETAASLSQSTHDAIQAAVESTAQAYGAIGLQAAVIHNGQVLDTFSYGWATRSSDPMTTEHKLRVASISKVSVGMAAMLLREQGIVDLDESIGTYWGCRVVNPSHPDRPISLRALLSHTSTIRAFDTLAYSQGAVRSTLQSGGSYTGQTPGDMAAWGYNNYAFAVLGMTLELAADRHLDDILRDGLWQAMEVDAAFEAGSIQDTDKLATVYTQGGGVGRSTAQARSFRVSSAPGASGASFAGGLTTSAADLAKLTALLANDGCYEGVRLLSAESVALMEHPCGQTPDGFTQCLPLRCQTDIYGRDRLYYHTGSAYGVYNCMSYDPDTGDGVVVLTSGASPRKDDFGIYAVCGEITQAVYDQLSPAGSRYVLVEYASDQPARRTVEPGLPIYKKEDTP